MIQVHQALNQKSLRAKMLLQVHDELVFEVPPEEAERMQGLVRSIMEGVYELKVPLKVDVKMGSNWAEVH
jgi:DNA polymerase-1